MATVVDELNSLLMKVRGIQESARGIADEFDVDDQNITRGLGDVIDDERWTSSGLYHRITQLDGTPTLLSTESSENVAVMDGLQAKLKALCTMHEAVIHDAKSILEHYDLEDATQQLLTEIISTHQTNATWCNTMLEEWEED